MRLGLLLPHFGSAANGDRIIEGARRAEALGFDSVWVRDHLLYEPHGKLEDPDRSFFEALTTLTAVGASTTSLTLGTGALIPYRHPLQLAHAVSSMTQFFGPRLVIGFGAGNGENQFRALRLDAVNRVDLVQSNIKAIRQVWAESHTSYEDEFFVFDDASIEPRPHGGPPPFWYCGTTPRSARIAAASCDGWMPGRIGIETLKVRVKTLDEHRGDRPRPTVGMIPSASIGKDRNAALDGVNVAGLLDWANNSKFWVKPPSGLFETVEDLRGMFVHGSPEDFVEQCRELEEVGVEHLVFDSRLTFDRWEEQIDLIGEQVLPEFR